MSKENEIKPELAYQDACAELDRDENGAGELVFWFGLGGLRMVFKLKNRRDWELFRRSWRVIRRHGSVRIVDGQQRLMAQIFAVDGSVWEAA